jgi:hypothetical protein
MKLLNHAKRYIATLLATISLAGCQTAPIEISPEARKALEKFEFPIKPSETEAVVYIAQGKPTGFLTSEKLGYKLVRKFQIGSSDIKQAIPGEYITFKMKPGIYDIRVEAVCNRTNNSILPPDGSTITTDSPGFIKYESFLSHMPSGQKQTFEAGNIYVYATSPSCYLNRYDGQSYLLLGMARVEQTDQAKMLIYKSKPAKN